MSHPPSRAVLPFAIALVSCAAPPPRRPPEPTVAIAAPEEVAPAPAAPPPPKAPPPPPQDRREWLDACEASFREVAATLSGYGKITTWRDSASRSADNYEAFIHAAARDPSLVAGAKPQPDDDAIFFALGPALEYRIVLVSKSCHSGNWEYSTPWAPRDKYWDRDEIYRQHNGVNAAIHYDARDPEPRTKAFVDAFREVVDTCIARRPPIKPVDPCPAYPG